jgi:hypothetical protein
MLSNKIPVLTEEEKNILLKIMNTKHASYLDGRFFEIEINVDYDLVKLQVLLRNKSGQFYYPVEAQIAFKEQNLSPKDSVLFLIDYIDFYFDEFFKENGEVLLSIDWSKHTFEEKEFQVKGQIFNLERERLADEWLKKAR